MSFPYWQLGSPDYDQLGRSVDRKGFYRKPIAAAVGLRPACSRIIYDYTHITDLKETGGFKDFEGVGESFSSPGTRTP